MFSIRKAPKAAPTLLPYRQGMPVRSETGHDARSQGLAPFNLKPNLSKEKQVVMQSMNESANSRRCLPAIVFQQVRAIFQRRTFLMSVMVYLFMLLAVLGAVTWVVGQDKASRPADRIL